MKGNFFVGSEGRFCNLKNNNSINIIDHEIEFKMYNILIRDLTG